MNPDQAREIVKDLYEDRRDKLGYPEFEHIKAVAESVGRYLSGAPQWQEKEKVAVVPAQADAEVVAWLHDTVEDGLLSLRELYHDLSGVQFEALLMISRDGRQTYMNYIRMIKNYPGLVGEIIRAVKLADLRHNISRPCPEHMRGMREPGGRYDRAVKLLEAA